ncbi:SGNH/GDSL hydrolase family protein [Nocardia transvalensis]|uniref:SGNH/GDSL hydrolase family protein n=1 Tax=Nocardia transvalensis TaxID=37333 RepID=UPI0018938B34|nr:GDSL-type esterase/lipase family protein [Nocardia transvalensis]MBF6329948.1 hypothetical protein [Nocardia transvalensis]
MQLLRRLLSGLTVRIGELFGALCACAALLLSAAGPTAAATPSHYLALGDSIAAGYRADSSGGDVGASTAPGSGYADLIADALARQATAAHRPFSYTNLARPGETTRTMIEGAAGQHQLDRPAPQLVTAEEFLCAHHEDRVAVTIGIGLENIRPCLDEADIDCVSRGIGVVARDLDTILGRLRSAAGSQARIVTLGYYNPYLALPPTAEREAVAAVGIPAIDTLNAVISAVAGRHGVPIAELDTAFARHSYAPQVTRDSRRVPLSTARVLEWTNMAVADIHPNEAGHRAIADTVAPLLRCRS